MCNNFAFFLFITSAIMPDLNNVIILNRSYSVGLKVNRMVKGRWKTVYQKVPILETCESYNVYLAR